MRGEISFPQVWIIEKKSSSQWLFLLFLRSNEMPFYMWSRYFKNGLLNKRIFAKIFGSDELQQIKHLTINNCSIVEVKINARTFRVSKTYFFRWISKIFVCRIWRVSIWVTIVYLRYEDGPAWRNCIHCAWAIISWEFVTRRKYQFTRTCKSVPV